MLEITELSKGFGKKEVLHNISCSLENGVYGLLGPNGAGKTTLLRCILGLYPCDSGSVYLNKRDIFRDKKRMNIGYLPQRSSVFPGLTVEEHLQYFANMKRMQKKQMQVRIDEVLKKVHLTEEKHVKGCKLSGGMVRRLGIAQALLNNPELVIFDEPTTGLDPEERIHFKDIVRNLGKSSIVIMSTHIVEDVEAVCSQIIVIKEGNFCAQGTQEEICQFAKGKVYEISREELSEGDYVEREKEIEGKEMLRILTSKSSDMYNEQKPTVEDGYLCILKGI